MVDLLPFKFNESYVYDSNFVRGYSIEHYEDRLSDCYKHAQEGMKKAIREIILSKYDYDTVDYLNMNVKFSNELYSYRMLPIYSFEFEWKKNKYMVLMNGQTGKVGGGYPKSALKIFLTVLGIVVLAALLTWLFIYMGMQD